MPAEKPDILTLDEVADYLQVHPTTIYRLLKQNKLPGVFKVGSDYRFRRDVLEEWTKGRGI